MRDVLYYMRLNNEEYLESSKFLNIFSPKTKGSLICNLLDLKKRYEDDIEKEIIYHDKLIIRGKLMAVQSIIDESNLYSSYVEDTTDYGKVIELIFHLINDFKNNARRLLKHNDRNNALVHLSASEEVNNLISIIDKDYWRLKDVRKECYG